MEDGGLNRWDYQGGGRSRGLLQNMTSKGGGSWRGDL